MNLYDELEIVNRRRQVRKTVSGRVKESTQSHVGRNVRCCLALVVDGPLYWEAKGKLRPGSSFESTQEVEHAIIEELRHG